MSSLLLLPPTEHTSIAGSVKIVSPALSMRLCQLQAMKAWDGFRQAAPQVANFSEVARLGAADAQASRGDGVPAAETLQRCAPEHQPPHGSAPE